MKERFSPAGEIVEDGWSGPLEELCEVVQDPAINMKNGVRQIPDKLGQGDTSRICFLSTIGAIVFTDRCLAVFTFRHYPTLVFDERRK